MSAFPGRTRLPEFDGKILLVDAGPGLPADETALPAPGRLHYSSFCCRPNSECRIQRQFFGMVVIPVRALGLRRAFVRDFVRGGRT
jgi:hypothetical protein